MRHINDEKIIQKIFDLKNLSFGKNDWIWWFWLFFFENPTNPEKPRQVAILWSARNDIVKCNGMRMETKKILREDGSLDGGVAAWYFDGSKMHDNLLLSRVKINRDKSGIITSSPNTSFQFNEGVFHITVEDKMKFEATLLNDANRFISPWEKEHKYFGLGYDMIGINKLNLKASINGEISEGSAYFQKVFLKGPAVPWYWGIFHFKDRACLSYFNPHLLGKSIKKDVSFYDGKTLHRFNNITVKKIVKPLPTFHIMARNEEKTIEFLVETYSKTTWEFRKKKLGLIPLNFNYRQYPARITRFKFNSPKTNLTLSDLGDGIGNAEHSTGILW